MAVEVHIFGTDGFGKPLWRVHAPWIDADVLRRTVEFTQDDPLTWSARIEPVACRFLVDRKEPTIPWLEGRAAELRERLRSAETRQVEIVLAEW